MTYKYQENALLNDVKHFNTSKLYIMNYFESKYGTINGNYYNWQQTLKEQIGFVLNNFLIFTYGFNECFINKMLRHFGIAIKLTQKYKTKVSQYKVSQCKDKCRNEFNIMLQLNKLAEKK